MIEFDNISIKINNKKILENINFSVSQGECVALLGESGSGKSTLIRILMGLISKSSGEIKINNKIVSPTTDIKLRTRFGYVIQSGGLFPHFDARQNVVIAIKSKLAPTQIEERLDQVAEICHFHKEKFSRYPQQLSGGEKQRVALMRALINQPDFIILDEPLGALDPITRASLQDELQTIFSSLKKTVMIVTHDVAEAAFFAQKIVLLRQGKIIQVGTIQELINNPVDNYVRIFLESHRVIEKN